MLVHLRPRGNLSSLDGHFCHKIRFVKAGVLISNNAKILRLIKNLIYTQIKVKTRQEVYSSDLRVRSASAEK